MIYRRILSRIALVAGTLLFSAATQTFAAFTPPTAAPPQADAYAPLNTGPATQTKTGQLNVNKVQIANKWLLGDTGNDDWLRVFNTANNTYYGGVAANNLWVGNFLYVNGLIAGSGSGYSIHGSISIGGSKNGWSGINFPGAGTLMMHPGYSGFFNAADNNWRWYVDDNGNSVQPGSASIGGNLTVGGKKVCLQDGTNCPGYAQQPTPTPTPTPAPAPVCSIPTVTNHGSGCMQWNTCTGSITSSVSGSCQYNFGCANPGGNGWMNDVLITACTAEYGGTLAATGYWNWTCTIGASCKGGGFDADCTANNGNPTSVPDGTRVCVFNAASCPVYYSQYQSWSTTQSNNPSFWYGSPGWYSLYSDPGCSTPINDKACPTGSHTWGNAGIESCSVSAYSSYLNENQPYLIDPNTGNYVFDANGNYIMQYLCNYYSSATVSASRTQIGCVR